MGKLSKQILISATLVALSRHSSAIPVTAGIYDVKPKNAFRGGSRGKGGKIKYKRG